jgi:hypothetical protein
MPYDTSKLALFLPKNSITTTDSEASFDNVKPFSYTEWLTQCGNEFGTQSNRSVEYNKYIRAWNEIKTSRKKYTTISEKYIYLIKNIALNYTTTEEKRFLQNIDYTNVRHVETALSFFSKKIKDISLYYSSARERIRQAKVKFSNPGGRHTLKNYIYDELIRISDERSIIGGINIKDSSPEKSKTIINIENIYELSVESDEYEFEFDVEVFRDIQTAIRNVLNECSPMLEISEALTFQLEGDLAPTEENISLLDYENFIDYTKSSTKLNINTHDDFVTKITGSDMYILSGGEYSKLFSAENRSKNIYTPHDIKIKTKSRAKLKTKRQLGNLYVPRNLGTLTYYSLSPEPEIIDKTLIDKIIADPNMYGTRGIITHKENVEWVKASAANDGLAGDIIGASIYPKFFSYRSDEEYKGITDLGVSRATDATGFFSGEGNLTWSNEDVFPREATNIYRIDERQETLFVGDYTAVKWYSDINGNQYALYKPTSPRSPGESIDGESEEEYRTNSVCQIIDGGGTLKKRSRLWEPGVAYKIIEGGRRWGIDPKVEQQRYPTPFEDLRQMAYILNESDVPILQLEEHNSFNLEPDSTRTRMLISPITYHGFKKQNKEPTYDSQAYCGLFTDLTCGQISPAELKCNILDSYAFGTFSEQLSTIDGQQYYMSDQYESTVVERDAYELYLNSSYVDVVGFNDVVVETATGAFSAAEILLNEDIDGNFFGDEVCDPSGAEYTYEVNRLAEYFDHVSSVSKSRFAEVPADVSNPQKTLHAKRSETVGKILFRSYNSMSIGDLSLFMSEIMQDTGEALGSDKRRFNDDVKAGKVVDFAVFYDTIMIRTHDFVYFEKINFSAETSKILKSKYPGVLVRVGDSLSPLDKSIKELYIPEQNVVLYGQTKTLEVDNKSYAYPIIHKLDLNSMHTTQIFPTKTNDNDPSLFALTDTLSGFHVEYIHTPILCYNETIDQYSVSFSCKIRDEQDNICYGVCIGDFEPNTLGYNMYDVYMYKTKTTTAIDEDINKWENKKTSLTYQFNPSEIPVNDVTDTYHTISLNGIFGGEPYRGYLLDVKFNLKTLPLPSTGRKINEIILDPGDGSEQKRITREIVTGEEEMNFDIGDIPDQSDFSDPRIAPMSHLYKFSDATVTSYTSTLSVVFADFTKLVLDMNLNVDPHTVESGFTDMVLIDTKTYTDSRGKSKQILTIETQDPRYVTNTAITKTRYSNSSVIGYVDGIQYTGAYHQMTDGTYMTGESHTPGSQYITVNP